MHELDVVDVEQPFDARRPARLQPPGGEVQVAPLLPGAALHRGRGVTAGTVGVTKFVDQGPGFGLFEFVAVS